QIKGGEGGGRGGEAEVGFPAVHAETQKRVEKREGDRHIAGRPQRLDEADLGERGGEGGFADLPRDTRCRLDERPALALALLSPGRSILAEAAPQVGGLAHVEQHPGLVVQAIDPRLGRDPGQEVGAELLVEEPHGDILSGGPVAAKLFPQERRFLWNAPPFMMTGRCAPCFWKRPRSCRGLPSTRRRSASDSGAIAPRVPSRRSTRAATVVADRMTSIGFITSPRMRNSRLCSSWSGPSRSLP